jgi:hypothetical protein
VKNAAVGFRVHSGWSALVAICLDGRKPLVLRRKRMQLVEIFNYDFRQPYHTAKRMPEGGAEFIAGVRAQGAKLACDALRELQAELKEADCRVTAGAILLASGRTLPALEQILASHALIHTADGELFREAVAEGCEQCGIKLSRVREKNLLAETTKTFRVAEAPLLKQITELGRELGSPWSQDEKFATLAAWLALAQTGQAKPPKKIVRKAKSIGQKAKRA